MPQDPLGWLRDLVGDEDVVANLSSITIALSRSASAFEHITTLHTLSPPT